MKNRLSLGNVLAVVVAVVVVLSAAMWAQADPIFNDSARVNVMRQFDPVAHTQMAGYSEIRTSTGGFQYVWGGSPWKPAQREGGSYLDAAATATSTITLPTTSTVGSFRVQFSPSYQNIYPAQWQLEGWNSTDGWFSLYTGVPASYDYAATFTPKSVSKVRYTSTGPTSAGSGQYNYTFQNLNLYLSTGQTVPLYNSGYSLIHDSGRVVSSNTSPQQLAGQPWGAVNSGNGLDAINGNYESYVFKGQLASDGGSALSGQRCYATWNFDQAYQMSYAMLAGVYDYGIGNWEVYATNSLNLAALNGLSSATPAAIQGAGWTLQYQQVGTPSGEKVFDFANPGQYKYMMLVWDAQHAAIGQLEVYGNLPPVPEPATMALLALGGLVLVVRSRENIAR